MTLTVLFAVSTDCTNREETHGRKMGALLARLPWKEFRLPRCARKKPLRVLQFRTKQNLLFDLQGILSEHCLSRYLVGRDQASVVLGG